MSSLFGGKTKTTSQNPAWLDKAGEETFGLAKQFMFKPKERKYVSEGVYAPSEYINGRDGTLKPQEYDVSLEGLREQEQYGGQRVADFDPAQQQAHDLASAAAGRNRGFGQARNYLTESTQDYGKEYTPSAVNAQNIRAQNVKTSNFDEGYLQQFLNPYLQTALSTTSDEMQRVAGVDKLQRDSGMVSRGSFGGSRQAIADSEGTRNLLDRVGSMYKTGMSEGYDRALSNYMQEASRKLQASTSNQSANLDAARSNQSANLDASKFNQNQLLEAFNANRDQFNKQKDRKQSAARSLGDLANIESNISSQDVERLLRTGATKQGQQQIGLDTAYEDWKSNRDLPFERLDYLNSIISGSPSKGAMAVTQQPSILSQIAGATAAVVGASNMGGGGKSSDIRLKDNIERVGEIDGVIVYDFSYKGSDARYRGVMAQDIISTHPEAVMVDDSGFYSVDYDKLPVNFERVA